MNQNLLKFLATKNTVQIRNSKEFLVFSGILEEYDLRWMLKDMWYDDWMRLVAINRKPKDKDKPCVLVFEYDVDKGLTFYTNLETPTEWYGNPPYTVEEIR